MCVFSPAGRGGGDTPQAQAQGESQGFKFEKGVFERYKITLKEFLEEHDCIINYLLRYISLFGEGGSPLYEDAIMIG